MKREYDEIEFTFFYPSSDEWHERGLKEKSLLSSLLQLK